MMIPKMQAGVIGAVAVKYLQIGWKRKVHRIDRVLVPTVSYWLFVVRMGAVCLLPT